MKLYSYFRSSAAYRVRIALALKQLPFETIPVHLLRDGGQQYQPAYLAKNPMGIVPSLETDDGLTLTQSLAIIEYLDETNPSTALLPTPAAERARVRALALTIACDIHPINNLRILKYLQNTLGVSADQKNDWYLHWLKQGLAAVEAMLANDPQTGIFCHGDTPGLADCCLVPQVFNAKRFNLPMEDYPTINRIVDACEALPAFQQAAPAQQPDAEA
ncbi:MAG: maleylacetoacetate isomerase [Paenalcaligenes sp.]